MDKTRGLEAGVGKKFPKTGVLGNRVKFESSSTQVS